MPTYKKILWWFCIAIIVQQLFGQSAREFGFQLGYWHRTGEWKNVIELSTYVAYEQDGFTTSGVTLYVPPALYNQCQSWK